MNNSNYVRYSNHRFIDFSDGMLQSWLSTELELLRANYEVKKWEFCGMSSDNVGTSVVFRIEFTDLK